MDGPLVAMRAVYAVNVLVAGTVGAYALINPGLAARHVFQGAFEVSEVYRITGALWLAIAALSAVGLFQPMQMSPVLLLQLLYKGGWLLAVAMPALIAGRIDTVPAAMAAFFLVWVIILPFVVPWRALFLT